MSSVLRKWIGLGLGAVLLGGVVVYFQGTRRTAPVAGETAVSRPVAPVPPAVPAAVASAAESATARAAAELLAGLRELARALQGSLPPAAAGQRLAEAAALLRAAPREAATTAVIALLDQRMDAPTGLGFKLAAGGNLEQAPTLRVWLLDQLGQIDAAEGGTYASRIYAERTSADEWALALRNDWRASAPAGRLEPVRARALELLQEETWARQPTDGFLEAFDLAVATLAWEAVPRLEALLQGDREERVRRAAWIALDRLALETPTDFLPALARRPDWLETQPLIRAGLFARADLAAERERLAVESYLGRPGLSPEEGAKFFALVPNINATISHALTSSLRAPSLHDAARLDRATLAAVQAWRDRPDFGRWQEALTAAEARLRESVASAVRGGFTFP